MFLFEINNIMFLPFADSSQIPVPSTVLFGLSDPERQLKRRQDEKPAAYKAAIRQLADGVPVATICARFAFARSTVYRWRARLAIKADLHRELVEENRRLRRQVQMLAAEKAMLQSILRRGG